MPEHTVPKRARELQTMHFSADEAQQMLEKGFRFGIYQPTQNEYRLAAPYRVAINIDRDTLTFTQGERPV
jgi:hypothetical protein